MTRTAVAKLLFGKIPLFHAHNARKERFFIKSYFKPKNHELLTCGLANHKKETLL